MEQLVRVQKINSDGTAQVMYVRQSACSGDCHKCSGCGAVQQKMLFTAYNPIGAEPGALVTVRTDSAPVLAAAVMLYILPVILFFLGYFLGEHFWGAGGLVGCGGFVAGIALAAAYDRCVVRKQKIVYTITGFSQTMPEAWEKGDNDLD